MLDLQFYTSKIYAFYFNLDKISFLIRNLAYSM